MSFKDVELQYGAASHMDNEQLRKMRRHRRRYRFRGVIWTLVGGMLTVGFVAMALIPDATIRVNGVVTSAPGPKVVAVVFASTFLLAGLGFLLMPARYLDRLFVWKQSLWSMWRR